MERIMNDAIDLDQHVIEDAISGPLDCVCRDVMMMFRNRIITV